MKGITNSYSVYLFPRLGRFLSAHLRKGKILETVFYSLVYPPFNLVMWLLFKMDPLFYPSIEKVSVDRPLIILGHYRSGTTYLQKLIAESGAVSFSTFRSLLFPSLVMMKIFTPIAAFINKLKLMDSEKKGHRMSLFEIEEDEGLFLHSLNTEMLTVFCPWMLTQDGTSSDGIHAGWNDYKNEDVDIIFLKDYIKRQLVSQHKVRALVKTNPSVFRIRKILKYLPDARFIYLYRDPVETIPSFFSLQYNFIRKRLNNEEVIRYFNKKYTFSMALYKYFERIKSKIPAEQLLTVKFTDLKSKPDELIRQIFDYADLELTDAYAAQLKQKRSEKHSKKHQNIDFSFAGITTERIQKDFRTIRQHYG